MRTASWQTVVICVVVAAFGLAPKQGGAAGLAAERAQRTAAPLPEAARGPAIPQDKGYLLEEIGRGLYWVTGGLYHAMFLVTGEGVVVVDAPPSIGQNLMAAIEEVTDEPVTHVVYTHSHADHIAAADIFPDTATFIAHEETAARLATIDDPDRLVPYGVFVGGSAVPMPTVTFDDRYELNVGSQTLVLEYHGAHHEPGNIYVYAPEQKVLMVIDIIFPGWVPFKNLALAEDTRGYVAAHDTVLSYDFDVLVSGHWGRLGTREDAEIQRDYIRDIESSAAQALQTVDFMAIAQETGFENTSLLFDVYLDAVIKSCEDSVVPRWIDRLGGADVFTGDHCHQIIQMLRVD